MAYNCHLSNYKNVYNTFLASRQILLSHDIYLSSITFPKIHLFNNLNSWYVFRNQKCELYQSSKYVNAIVASKQAVDKGGDPQEPHFFVMHTGVWNLVLDFGSGNFFCFLYTTTVYGGYDCMLSVSLNGFLGSRTILDTI